MHISEKYEKPKVFETLQKTQDPQKKPKNPRLDQKTQDLGRKPKECNASHKGNSRGPKLTEAKKTEVKWIRKIDKFIVIYSIYSYSIHIFIYGATRSKN